MKTNPKRLQAMGPGANLGQRFGLIVIILLLAPSASIATELAELRAQANKVFGVMPSSMPGAGQDTRALIKLGRNIYFDRTLSSNHKISCNSCHSVDDGGAYPLIIPRGASGKTDQRDSPTVWNAGFQFAQFWDGRAKTLESQATEPMLNPDEMGMSSEDALLARLQKSFFYPHRFRAAFAREAQPITIQNVARALAAFERTLITHDRFDDFLRGSDRALSRAEKRGLETFLASGCQQCHHGPALGGNSYEKIGLLNPYENLSDPGRAKITSDPADQFKFKVPPLRNVALTAPYFHDGKIARLDIAVKKMAYLQLNKELSPEQVADITSFLLCLTDKKQALNKKMLATKIKYIF